MRKPSVTYRFFCTLTALLVLLSTSIPAGAHAGMLADFCGMDMSEHHESHVPEGEYCDLAASHQESGHNNIHADVDTEDCLLNFVCSCSIDEAGTQTTAIPLLSKTFADHTPVVVDILDDSIGQEHPHSSGQVFASLYSPPIFLKNSSFLN